MFMLYKSDLLKWLAQEAAHLSTGSPLQNNIDRIAFWLLNRVSVLPQAINVQWHSCRAHTVSSSCDRCNLCISLKEYPRLTYEERIASLDIHLLQPLLASLVLQLYSLHWIFFYICSRQVCIDSKIKTIYTNTREKAYNPISISSSK